MNTKTSMIILGVIGSITGLCVVANYCLTAQPEPIKPKAKVAGEVPDQKNLTTNEIAKTKNDGQKESFDPEPEKELDKQEIQNPTKAETVQVQVEKDQSEPIKPLPVADEFPLRLGSKGPRVERLQVWLMRNFGRTGIVTGTFTEDTEAELKRRLHKTKLDEGTYQRYRMGKHVHEQVFIR